MPFLSSEILRDVIGSRPAAGDAGRIFFSTDEGKTYRDSGSAWENCSDTGVVASVAGRTGAVTLTEADLSTSDITTNNVSITKHGFAPKAPNDATKYLDGTGAYTIPAGSTGGTVTHTAGALTVDLPVLGNGVSDVKIGTKTGTGDVVFATSPTLITPSLGTPSGAVLTNATSLPLSTGVTGTLPVANGGTGTSSPGIVAGTGISISGSFPTQTVTLAAQPYDIPCSLPGKPGAAAIVLIFTATRAVSFSGNFSGAYGTVGTNPTATAAYDVLTNGSSIGTVSISTSGVFTFTTTSGASKLLAAGDRLTVTAPSSQDATLSDVGFTLAGTR